MLLSVDLLVAAFVLYSHFYSTLEFSFETLIVSALIPFLLKREMLMQCLIPVNFFNVAFCFTDYTMKEEDVPSQKTRYLVQKLATLSWMNPLLRKKMRSLAKVGVTRWQCLFVVIWGKEELALHLPVLGPEQLGCSSDDVLSKVFIKKQQDADFTLLSRVTGIFSLAIENHA